MKRGGEKDDGKWNSGKWQGDVDNGGDSYEPGYFSSGRNRRESVV